MMQTQFEDFRSNLRNIIRSYLAGNQAWTAFEEAQAEDIVVKKPELRLKGDTQGNLFQKAPPFLGIAEQVRANRLLSPFTCCQILETDVGFPGRVLVMADGGRCRLRGL